MNSSLNRLSLPALAAVSLALVQCADDPADMAASAEVLDDADLAALELARSLGDMAPDEADQPPQEAEPEPEEDPNGTRLYVFGEGSRIGFVGSKPTAVHEGSFENFSGYFTVTGDDIDMAGTHRISIEMASVRTDDEELTEKLKDEQFFDVARFPVATFTLLKLNPRPEMADYYDVNGVLELHGIAKKITFPATIIVSNDGKEVLMLSRFSIDRKAFGIEYSGFADDLIRDRVVIDLNMNAHPGDHEPLKMTAVEDPNASKPTVQVLSADTFATPEGTGGATFTPGGGGAPAFGQGGGFGRGGGGRRGGGLDPAAMISSMDKDKDGKLGKDEMPEQMWSRMSEADADGDGAIDEAEWAAQRAKREAERAAGGGGGFGDGGGGRTRDGGGKGGGGKGSD